jgi:epoxide hydrolase-like predicted phosphatase
VIVDFGGVLTSDFFACLRGFCRREGLAEDTLVTLIADGGAARGMLADLERGTIGQPEFEKRMAELLGLQEAQLLQRMATDLRPEPRMLTALERLRATGVRVGVLSNSWGSHPFDPYAGWDLERRFDAVVVSDRVRLRKPDSKIYHLAVQRLGVPAEQCVFVDDVAAYLEPARAMGMTVVLQTDATTAVAELERLFGTPLH